MTQQTARTSTLLIGTYTHDADEAPTGSSGILSSVLSGSSLSHPKTAAAIRNPSWLTSTDDGRRVYAVSETSNGELAAYARNLDTGELTSLGSVTSAGSDPAHLELDVSGRFLLAANYSSGSITVHALQDDGSIGPMTDKVTHAGSSIRARQTSAHPHQIALDPGSHRFYVPDLGMDAILVYALDENGGLRHVPDARIDTQRGAGPRHLLFHPNGEHLLVLNELSSTVRLYRRNSRGFSFRCDMTTLPYGFTGENTASALRLTSDGRHVLASNRGHNSIAVIELNTDLDRMRQVRVHPSLGTTPRDFTLSPDGHTVVVAHQHSNEIVTFSFDALNGAFEAVDSIPLPSPVCLRFV